MNNVYFYFLRTLISLPLLIFATIGNSQLFEPDLELKKKAIEYDRQYFPLFLKAISDINKDSTDLISQYLNTSEVLDLHMDSIAPLESSSFNIVPVFELHFINEPGYEVHFPIQWTNIPGKDNSWNLYFQGMRWLLKYINSNDREKVLTAFAVINDWIIQHARYPISDTPFAYNDHAVSNRLGVLVQTYRKFKEMKMDQPEFEYRLNLSILSHVFLMASLEKYSSHNNHGIIMDNALIRGLKVLPEFKERDKLIQFAFQRMFEVYYYSFTSEGIHKEHSPCYHYQFANTLNRALQLAQELKVKVPPDIKVIDSLAQDYIGYIIWENMYPHVGDCARNRLVRTPASKVNHNNYVKVFSESGWLFINDTLSGIRLVSQSNIHSKVHYQEQETSFLLNLNEYELIIDPGLYSYTASPFTTYMRQAKAHNVLIVNGENYYSNFNQTGLSGITRYFVDSNYTYTPSGIVEMTHPHYLDRGVEIHRKIGFYNNHLLIRDVVKSKDENIYTQQFHLAPGAVIQKVRNYYVISWDNHPFILQIGSNADSHEIVEGQKDPIHGWYFPSFSKAIQTPVLLLNMSGQSISFNTTIRVINSEQISQRKALRQNHKHVEYVFGTMITELESIDRKKLTKQTVPKRWRPKR